MVQPCSTPILLVEKKTVLANLYFGADLWPKSLLPSGAGACKRQTSMASIRDHEWRSRVAQLAGWVVVKGITKYKELPLLMLV